jgi:hypothetical protein
MKQGTAGGSSSNNEDRAPPERAAQDQQNGGAMEVFEGADNGTNVVIVVMCLLGWLADYFARSNCTC